MRHAKECEWCKGAKDCPSEEPAEQRPRFSPGYLCTRPAGHDGKHIACCGSVHRAAEWEMSGIPK